MQTSIETPNNYPFTTQEIRNYIQMQAFKPLLITITSNNHMELLSLLASFKHHAKPMRKQVLINYQDHWFGLDVQCNTDDAPFSIIMLDAANAINNISGFTHLLNQMCAPHELAITFDLIHIASEHPLQKNSRDCSIFTWEHLRFAAQKENLHAQLHALKNSEDNQRHLAFSQRFIERCLTEKRMPIDTINIYKAALNTISWLDYSKLESNPEEWQDFFINTQSLLTRPAFLNETIKKWTIEKLSPDNKWTPHNIRIQYCGHLIKSTLESKQPLSENEFIIDMIRKSHPLSQNNINQVLRNAVNKGLIKQVTQLLELSDVDVNQISPTGNTALKLANSLQCPITKEAMRSLLLARGAVDGNYISSQLHTTSAISTADTTTNAITATIESLKLWSRTSQTNLPFTYERCHVKS